MRKSGMIELARRAKGMSQEDLARTVGVTIATIGALERGERATINLSLLCDVSYALDLRPIDVVAEMMEVRP
jgi:transcriptional regulator with XRE-family HTH domain